MAPAPRTITVNVQGKYIYVNRNGIDTTHTRFQAFTRQYEGLNVANHDSIRFHTKFGASVAAVQQVLAQCFPGLSVKVNIIPEQVAQHVVDFGSSNSTKANNTPLPVRSEPTAPTSTPTSTQAVDLSDALVKQILSALDTKLSNQLLPLATKIGSLDTRLTSNEQVDNSQGITLTTLADSLVKLDERINNLTPHQTVINTSLQNGTTHTTIFNRVHKQFAELLECIRLLDPAYRNILLVGPAGAGKSTAVRQVAEALSLDYATESARDSAYQLLGHIRPHDGSFNETPFYRLYKNGGVYDAAEQDSWTNEAVIALQTALANHYCTFANGETVARHQQFIYVGNANTFGQGPDSKFVGRVQLDAAFLDRFLPFYWEYDETFEQHFASCPTAQLAQEWLRCVQDTRHLAATHAPQFIISPRAYVRGANLLTGGMSRAQVVKLVFGLYRHLDTWRMVSRPSDDFIQ